MSYVIEKGIPVPERATSGRKRGPFVCFMLSLDVGDSILVTMKHDTVQGCMQSVKRLDLTRRYVTRKVEGGIRIWRTA